MTASRRRYSRGAGTSLGLRNEAGSGRGSLPQRFVQVPVGLQVQPELWRRLEAPGQAKGSVRRDAPLAQHELVESIERYAELPSGLGLRQAQGLEELLLQHLTGMDGRPQPGGVTRDNPRIGLRRHGFLPSERSNGTDRSRG